MAGVVLVHGAGHGSWCWSPVVEELQQRGIAVNAVDLPFTGFGDDVRKAREAVEAMGTDTVLVGHSYGGAVISEAASDNRSVRRLIYVTAFLCDAGEDTVAVLADYKSPLLAAFVATETGLTLRPEAARELFYGDSDDRTAAAFIARLRPIALPIGVQELEPGWKSIPSTYVLCTNDAAMPVDAQRWMATRADEVIEVASSHSPFVNHAGRLAEVVASYLP
jgi:pimeloyl-ACP methyl ester carboxylesterase